MSTINLAVEKEEGANYPNFFKSGLIGSCLVLALVLCVYGGLVYMNKNLDAKIQDVQAQYTDEYKKFLVGNANEVIDFGNRSAAAGRLIKQDKAMGDIFNQLEGSILPAVYLNSLEYDRNKGVLSLGCVTDGFNTEAKQILSFKESNMVSSVVLGKSMLDPVTGALNFSISLNLK